MLVIGTFLYLLIPLSLGFAWEPGQ